jgi:hypothetical protein
VVDEPDTEVDGTTTLPNQTFGTRGNVPLIVTGHAVLTAQWFGVIEVIDHGPSDTGSAGSLGTVTGGDGTVVVVGAAVVGGAVVVGAAVVGGVVVAGATVVVGATVVAGATVVTGAGTVEVGAPPGAVVTGEPGTVVVVVDVWPPGPSGTVVVGLLGPLGTVVGLPGTVVGDPGTVVAGAVVGDEPGAVVVGAAVVGVPGVPPETGPTSKITEDCSATSVVGSSPDTSETTSP